ncbi:hypothetical protein BJX61DRAFT_240475 [Aspergillus egyptiacus]|nr:hypothetical protein BJX61DRAFT_240475 [Aspergillus egyptiacus]
MLCGGSASLSFSRELSRLSPQSSSASLRSVVRGTCTISDTEKHQIYKRWIESGRPHNFVCTQCREPANLLSCETCCRSYHIACLPPANVPSDRARFYCPACTARRWDSTSPGTSRSSGASTPAAGDAARVMTPLRSVATSAQISVPLHSDTQNVPCTHVGTSMTDPGTMCPAPPDISDPNMLKRAREFLLVHGGFPESQEFSVDLLLKLGSMITERELHRQQMQELVSENSYLRQDNANIRAYLDSNLATRRPAARSSAGLSTIPTPSSDTSGKTWDRIITDLI